MIIKTAVSVTTDAFLCDAKDCIFLTYTITFSDKTIIRGQLSAYYPVTLEHMFDFTIIKNYFQIFICQLFLYNGIINLECDIYEESLYKQVTHALYAIRNYEEGTTIYPQGYQVKNCNINNVKSSPNRNVMNLVSGGKDSLVSDYLLEINNAKIFRCFINGLNTESNIEEQKACCELYDNFDTIKLNGFEKLLSQLSAISNCYGIPPRYNFIPKGRDILTLILVYPLAVNRECSFISHGCEKDLWDNNIIVKNVEIPLHDSQSKLVIKPLSQQIKYATNLHVFSPIAGMHEIYILSWLLNNHPVKIQHLQSCFFGQWCGECQKCLRYYLIAKKCNQQLFEFKNDPEKSLSSLQNQLYNITSRSSIGFYKEFCYLLGDNSFKKELFTPVYDDLFPSFFKKWELL